MDHSDSTDRKGPTAEPVAGPSTGDGSNRQKTTSNMCSATGPARGVSDLPMLVMEYILAHFSYYEVLQFRLISRFWDNTIRAYLDKADEVFQHNLAHHNVQWVAVKEQIEDFNQSCENISSISKKIKSRCIPKMSPRYLHSACYVNDSMYVFGGCISPTTAYNDLWRFDMLTKKWHRIIAAGTLPLPRLFCSFTNYECQDPLSGECKQFIVLFGGFLFDEKLDVKERLLSTIHFFDVAQNRWTLVPVEGDIQLKAGNHSAVIIGDELIVFNGLRMVGQQEVDCNQVYVFDLRRRVWSQQETSITSHCPFIRTTMESYRNQSYITAIRRKTVQTPFVLDSHNILYICGCNTNVLFIAAFLLTRARCTNPACQLCPEESTQPSKSTDKQQSESLWEWVPVDISKVGLDFEFTYGVEFCKVGNLLAYLTVKDVAIPRKNPPQAAASNCPARPQLGPREHISFANKQLLREKRMEALDFYQRQFEMQRNNNRGGGAGAGGPGAGPSRPSRASVVHSTLQLRLLDISRVVSERRMDRVRQCHEMNYSVVPEAISCYSLVASPESLLLFGGFVVDQQREEPTVSSKLFMISSKPEVKLY